MDGLAQALGWRGRPGAARRDAPAIVWWRVDVAISSVSAAVPGYLRWSRGRLLANQAISETFLGLAGVGDLVTTCTSPLSRNHFVGVELTKGRSLKEITDSMDGVAEGVSTTLVAWNLARKIGIEMPITEKIYRVLYQDVDPRKAVSELLAAEVKHELSGRRWKLFSFFRRKTRV